MDFKLLLISLSLSLFLVACSHEDSTKASDTSLAVKPPKGALAKVNETFITQDNVNVIKVRTLGGHADLTPELEGKLLESAIQSRAMAELFEKELSDDDRKRINDQVSAYHEELLVKGYLQKHTVAEPITYQMIQDYYQQNLNEFGQETRKTVEMLKSVVKKDNYAQLTNLLNEIANQNNWEKEIQKLKTGSQITVKRFEHRAGLLGQDLDQLISGTPVGKKTGLHIVGDTFYVFRIIKEEKTEAKPLSQVSSVIRKKLIPRVLAKTVAQAIDGIEKQVSITRYNNN